MKEMKGVAPIVIGLVILLAIVVAVGAWYVMKPPEDGEEEKYKFGISPYYIDDDWYRVDIAGANFYAQDRGWDLVWQNPSGDPVKQAEQIKYMVDGMNIDGLIFSATDPTICSTIEWVHDQGIPVIADFSAVETTKIDLYITSDYVLYGRRLAEETMKTAEKDGAEIEGYVIIPNNITEYRTNTITEGIKECLSNYPDLEVMVYDCPGSFVDDAMNKVTEAISAHGKPFAVFSPTWALSMGTMGALDSLDLLVPHGEEGHIYAGLCDGESEELVNYVEQGWVDATADDPNPHIECLATEFMYLIKENGVEALPPVGTIVVSDPTKPQGFQPDGTWNLVLVAKEHKGVNPLKYAAWAPAEMRSFKGLHKQLIYAPVIITPETIADMKPTMWYNLVGPWLD